MAIRLVSISLLLAVSIAAGTALAQDAADPLAAEASRRHTILVRDGYHITQRWLLGAGRDKTRDKTTVRLEFFVPVSGSEHTFSFWAESSDGEVAFRLLGPDCKTLASWSGQKGEVTVSLLAPSGKYLAEIDRPAGVSGRALFGVEGAALVKCDLDSGSLQERPASPGKGFHWPYLLFLPKELRSAHLLVVPNNTGFSTEDLELLRTSGFCEIERQTALAERLGTPLLVPLFPRPLVKRDGQSAANNLYLHALSRASLETDVERLRRVDLQLLAMMDDARAALHDQHVEVDSRVFLWGFSASGSFANRFAMLHPERVAAVACGSPGGWPIAPVDAVEGDTLPYPVGIADLKTLVGRPFDLAQARRVSWFFYMGDQDTNDAVPFRDSFSEGDEQLIVRRFGKTPVSRWKDAEHLYANARLHARFTLYPGASHSVTPEMAKDIALFFESEDMKSSRGDR